MQEQEVFLWDLDSFTPRMFVQMERDGFDLEMISELNTVMVTRTLRGVKNEKERDNIPNKLG